MIPINPLRRMMIVFLSVLVALAFSVGTTPVLAQSEFSGAGSGGTVSPGETITISYTVTNVGSEDDAAVLDVAGLPAGWTIEDTGGDADSFQSSTNEFVWYDIARGSDGAATLTLQVPSGASPGNHTIFAFIEDGDGNVDDTVSATVTVQTDQANFQVSDLSAPNTGLTGEAFTVEATVENTGSAEGTQTVEYRFDGSTEATQDVTLGAGESTTVSFSYTPESAGTFTHGVFTDDDSQTATIDVSDQPGFISGRVSDQNNEDIPNATISIFDAFGDFVKNTTTNTNGEYTVEVAPGSYRAEVVAVAQDFQFVTDQVKDLDVESGQVTTANLVVERVLVPTTISVSPKEDSAIVGEESSFTVTVLDQNGDPLSGVAVTASVPADSPIEFVSSSTVTTNSNGKATFTITSDERISDEEITFEAQGGDNPTTFATTTFESSIGKIKGEIINENNIPINGATVELQLVAYSNGTKPEEPLVLQKKILAPDNNAFSFVSVEPGPTYRVVATDPDTGETGFNELSLDTGGTTNADVVIVGGKGDSSQSSDPLQLKVIDATTTPDTEVTVEFNLTNTNDTAMFAALNVTTTPAGWAITDHTNDGASAYKSSTNEWVWFSLGAGNSARPTVTLSVPDGTPTDEYTIGAEALTGEFTTSATGTVTVSSTVAKPIDQAIAGSDNTISTTDLLTAVDYWQTGSEVPNTGGKTIDTTTLLNLVDKWKSGETV